MKTTLTTILFLIFGVFFAKAQTTPVHIIEIEGMIDNGLVKYIERSLTIAESDSLSTTVIFHIDTFGGLVDAADEIRKLILDTPLQTVAYIDKNAASAGALISLASDSIFMAPGSSIGAATVVQGNGEKASEKMQSYMRSLMRATAEQNGRNPEIAEAMVDESISIEGIIEEGKLLSLSTSEAIKYGIADDEIESFDELASHLNLEPSSFVIQNERWEEQFLRFLASPVISSILMLMMLGGLYFELQSPGLGFPGIVSLVGAMLFFSPLYILGLAESWEIVLFIVGIILIVLEIFVIPGFGLTGVSGIFLIIFSLGAALIGNIGLNFPGLTQIAGAIWTLSITLTIGIALIASLARYLPHNTYFSNLILTTSTSSSTGYVSSVSDSTLLGLTGKTLTPLRPTGTVLIDGRKISVVSDGEYVETGTEVTVVSSEGNRVIVTKNT